MDLVIDLLKTKNQKDMILVIIDMLSKMIRLVITKKELLSKELVQLLTNNIIALFSIFKEIVSNNDVRITAKAWKEMCKVLEITSSTAALRH